MHPEETPIPQPAVPEPASPQLAPIAQLECWHLPKGNFSIFGYRKCHVVFYPGWMVVYSAADHSEQKRLQLTPDLRIKYFLNTLRVSHVGGQKIGIFNLTYSFFTTTILSYALVIAGLLVNVYGDFTRLGGYKNPGYTFIAFLLLTAALVWMGTGIPKSKAFIAAAKQAAGIAS